MKSLLPSSKCTQPRPLDPMICQQFSFINTRILLAIVLLIWLSMFITLICLLLRSIMQSCDLQLCFMLALFHDKKCCNCFNLYPWYFVGFYCIEFSIKLVKTQA